MVVVVVVVLLLLQGVHPGMALAEDPRTRTCVLAPSLALCRPNLLLATPRKLPARQQRLRLSA